MRHMDEFDRIVDDFFGNGPSLDRRARATRQWMPAADVVAEEDAYLYRFDLPGVAKDAIEIDIADGVLTVRGKREDRSEEQDEAGRVVRRETFTGSFQRSFRLPENADGAAASAEHRDGVLEIRVPRSAAAQKRRIEIGNA